MHAWLRAQGRAAATSYIHEKALAASDPGAIVVAAGALAAVLGAIGYLPAIVERAQMPHPWVPLVLCAAGALTTYIAWRHECRGPVGVAATIIDNGMYSAPLVYAAATTTEHWGLGLALVHGLMVLGFASPVYALTLPFAVVMAAPLVIILPLFPPPVVVSLVLGCTYILTLLLSYITDRRRAHEKQQARLVEAVSATERVADESVQLALTTALLSLGHFLHELRNSQTAMKANLNYIEMCSELSDGAREALEDALKIQSNEEQLVTKTIDQLR
ncbi:MAG: hypothetical protein AAGA56_03825, partial [Myxococcota bacterium]